jgi:hypothetical protein
LELIKIKIKEFSIYYSAKSQKIKQTKTELLEQKINNIDGILAKQCTQNSLLTNLRKEYKLELDQLNQDKTYAAFVRSRAKYFELGERNTSYFLRLEENHQINNVIDKLINDKGQTAEDDFTILKHCHSFYSNLYSSKNPNKNDIENYVKDIKIEHKLTLNESNTCEGLIDIKELHQIKSQLKANKSPGIDGLSSEFYKSFWDIMTPLLCDYFNEAYSIGKLGYTTNTAVLTLIFKKGEKTDIRNYRPISLCNIDYKILAFVLANRIQGVISKVISQDQTGYIKNRSISSNIRKLLDINDYLKSTNKKGILLLLDFEKAFDSVEWPFLHSVLNAFNFGKSFQKWIKLLYKNPVALIKNNGWLSEPTIIHRGIRQGCPVSAILFILVVEILALKLKQNGNIKGITVQLGDNINQFLLSQYADDMCIFLKDKKQINETIETVVNFGNLAGPLLNLHKTEAIYLGNQNLSNNINYQATVNGSVYEINFPKQPIRCLGVYIGGTPESQDKKNWFEKLNSIEKTLNSWKQRHLTLFGKTCIINTLIIPKLIYAGHFLPVPVTFIKKANQLIYKFIWGGKEHLKRTQLISNFKDGGLNIVDLQSKFNALKANWISKLHKNHDNWTKFGNYYLNLFGKDKAILSFNFHNSSQFPQIKLLPVFYQEVIISFNKSKPPTDLNDKLCILDESLWGNYLIINYHKQSKSHKTLYFKHWIDAGLVKVGNLKFDNGVIDEKFIYEKVKNKANIFSEVTVMRQSLKKYCDIIGNHTPANYKDNDLKIVEAYSQLNTKGYYNGLILNVKTHPISEYYWKTVFQNIEMNMREIYNRKFCIKDKYLAQFNFKMINLILPTNKNLYKWKISGSDLCPICMVTHDLKHLLFDCGKAQLIWNKIEQIFKIKISFCNLVCGFSGDRYPSDFTLSLICYFIYKEWLKYKNHEHWEMHDIINYIRNELKWRLIIYRNMKNQWSEYINNISYILNSF